MSEKMYKTDYSNRITEVEIVKQTDKSIWVSRDNLTTYRDPQRRAKISVYDRYHETWDLARDYVISRLRSELNSHKNILERLDRELTMVQLLVKP